MKTRTIILLATLLALLLSIPASASPDQRVALVAVNHIDGPIATSAASTLRALGVDAVAVDGEFITNHGYRLAGARCVIAVGASAEAVRDLLISMEVTGVQVAQGGDRYETATLTGHAIDKCLE